MNRTRSITRISILSIFIGITAIAALMLLVYLYGRSESSTSVATLKQTHDRIIQSQTETAASLLDALYQQHLAGEISLDEAKERGASLLRQLRYGAQKEGYFWADTTDGINVVLYGDTDVEGSNRWDAHVGGVYYVRELIRNGMREGGGFTDYYFPKRGDSIPLAKRGFTLVFTPFNWVIGTGYYLEDLK